MPPTHTQRRIPRQTATPPPYRRNRPRKKWGRIVLCWAAAIVVVGLITWLLTSPRFEIKSVQFSGNTTIPAAELAKYAPVPHHANLFLYVLKHHKQVARAIIDGEPAVLEAHVRPRLPNILAIAIVERTPYVQLRENHGGLWLVDKNGVAYRTLPGRKPALTAIVVPLGSISPVLGKPMPSEPGSLLGAAFAAYGAVQQTPGLAGGLVKDIRVDLGLDLCLNTTGNLLIKLGQPTDLDVKTARVAAILADSSSGADSAIYVDVTEPNHPAIMPKPGSGSSGAPSD